jgi:formylmethanofuran dehydrogenase subunit E
VGKLPRKVVKKETELSGGNDVMSNPVQAEDVIKPEQLNLIILACTDCGQDCSKSYGEVDGKPFCDKCFDKNFRECTDCGKLKPKADGKFFKRKFFCIDCYDRKYTLCGHCHEKLAKEDAKEHDGVLYCPKCFEELFVTCTDCGAVMLKDSTVVHEGKHYCQTCYDAMFVECVECHARVHRSSIVLVDGEPYCGHCFETQTVECDHCHRRVNINNAHEDEYIHLCSDCYDSNYYTCDSCGNFVHGNDLVSRGSQTFCPDCAPTRDIHDYSFKPTPRFYGGFDEFATFMGVELECDSAGEDSDNARRVLNITNAEYRLLYCKHDGSLNRGFEMVTYPCTLDWHMNKFPWKDALKKCRSMGYKSHDSGNCGLHVHISRKAFGTSLEDQDVNIMKLLFFFEKFWTKMVRFSRRTDSQLSRWAKRYGMKRTPQELLNTAKGSERYYAVNLCNQKTIELRLFRGTLKYSTFIATLQFVHELVRILKESSVDEVTNTNWLDFVRKMNPEYRELGEYLERRGLSSEPMTTGVAREDTDNDEDTAA